MSTIKVYSYAKYIAYAMSTIKGHSAMSTYNRLNIANAYAYEPGPLRLGN